MAGRDVPDLMPHDAGQLILGVGHGEQPARDVHESARQRKGVRLDHVNHIEMVLNVLPGGVLGQPLADRLHVGCELGIVRQTHRFLDFFRRLLADLTFSFLRHQDEVRAPGHRIHGAPF